MNLRRSAVILGRVLAFVEIADLLSGSHIFFPDLVRAMVEKYGFQKFPNNLEDMDLKKGVEFLFGKSGDRPVQKFAIWDTLIILETKAGTDVSKVILEEMLTWAAETAGLNYKPELIKRYGYISDVTFYSDVPILDVNPAVAVLAKRSSEELSRIWQEPVFYEAFTVRVGHDPTARKYGIAPFLIEHRAESRFSENKYFSEAPLPTGIHWEMLEQYERDMMLQLGKAGRA